MMPGTGLERVLLVEGPDDEHVVRQLCRRQSVPDFSIKVAGTVETLLSTVGAEMLAPGRESVGVLIDADDNLQGRWDELVERLSEEGIRIPALPNPAGTIVNIVDGPPIGIWVMPDNGSSGELEDFVQKMIPAGDAVWPKSQAYINQIPVELRKFRPGKVLRAQVYAWLATREIPGRMGAAIGAGDLAMNGAQVQGFLEWLRNLFGATPARRGIEAGPAI